MNGQPFDAKRNRTKRPLPLWVDAFQRDTMHLGADEAGAYMLILMAMWMRPDCDLPDDEHRMARVARVSLRLWKSRVGPAILPFLLRADGRLTSPRLTKEASYVERQVTDQHNRRTSDKTSKPLKDNDTGATGDATPDEPREHPTYNLQPTVREEEDPPAAAATTPLNAAAAADPTDRELILQAIGVDPVSGITGRGGTMLGTQADMAEVARWLDLPGLTIPIITEEIRRIMARRGGEPPSKFKFFNGAMAELSGALTAPPLDPIAQPATRGPTNDRIAFDHTIRRLADRLDQGTAHIDHRSRDPFAQLAGRDPDEGEYRPVALLRP